MGTGPESLEIRDLLAGVTVDVGQVVRAVEPQLVGVNATWWDSNLTTTGTQQLVRAAGLNLFRLPGGSSSDNFHFNAPSIFWGAQTLSSMATFVAAVNGQAVVTLDYGSGSPQEAAAELAYLNAPVTATTAIGSGQEWNTKTNSWQTVDWKTAGYWASLRSAQPLAVDDGLNFLRLGRANPFNFHYFEVGNEVYGPWEIDHHTAPHDAGTYVAFAKQFATYATAMNQPISIGVDSGGPGSFNNWFSRVLQQSIAQGFTVGFISDHNYVENPGAESDSALLLDKIANSTSAFDWKVRSDGYTLLLNQYLGPAGANVELLTTEFNSIDYNPGKQSTSLVNGLFIADSLGELMGTRYDGATVWDLRNGFLTGNNNSASLYGWRQGGDYGMLGFPPDQAPQTGTYVAYPNYFAEQLASKIIVAGGAVVKAASNDSNLTVYAVHEASGDLELLVINKSATGPITGAFQIANFQPAALAQVWQYGEAQDTAQSQSSTGQSALANFAATLSLSGSSFNYAFPAYSMTVLDLSQGASSTGPTPPSLFPIANQAAAAYGSVSVTLLGSDPDGDPLTYRAVAETSAYWLNQTYGFYEDSGGYHTNARGGQEKYLRGKVSANGYALSSDSWYYLVPNGNLYELTPPYGTALTGVLVARLGTAVYNDPTLLANAQNTAVPATLALSGNLLTITPSAGYTGTFEVLASVSDGTATAAGAFKVSIGVVNDPPSIAPIADQSLPVGGSVTVTLPGSDPDGDPLTYSALAETQLYWLEKSYILYEDSGGYYTNHRGRQEKYLRGVVSANGYVLPNRTWYYVMPNGDLYEFTPPYGAALTGRFVAALGTAVYNNPTLLFNAQNTAVTETLAVSGNKVTVTAGSGLIGTIVVLATASDGDTIGTRAFKVANHPPTLASIADQTLLLGGSVTVTLQGSDPEGDPLTLSARAETKLYWLDQTYGFYEDSGGYYTNHRGSQEKYFHGKASANGYALLSGASWYYLMPNGDLYEFTPPYGAALTGRFVARLGTAVYNNPSLLLSAQSTTVPATLALSGNKLTVTVASTPTDTFVVLASVSDSQSITTRVFKVANPPPSLAAIAGQSLPAGGSVTVSLQGSDLDGEPLSYSAVAETQIYWLQQTYGLYEDAGGFYTSHRGFQEKYLRGTVSAHGYVLPNDTWYYLMPNGDLYEFTPPYAAALTGVFVASLGTAVYTNPTLLLDAQNTAVPATVALSGNLLSIKPGPTFIGTFVVVAGVSNDKTTTTRAFKVVVS